MRLHWKRGVIFVLILALLTFLALQLSVSRDDGRLLGVWDSQNNTNSDRILEQIRYIPQAYERKDAEKTIFVVRGLTNLIPGNIEFYRRNCSVKNCILTDWESDNRDADAFITEGLVLSEFLELSKPGQIWIWYVLESPYSVPNFRDVKGLMNWTATYRRDSTIVTPYGKWVPFDPPVKSPSLSKNFAAGKTKKVAWFVSNCQANNYRLEYAKELAKYIPVDIMGDCGNSRCPRNKRACWQLLNTTYKFYLSFENSNCRDYITEKFFENGLR